MNKILIIMLTLFFTNNVSFSQHQQASIDSILIILESDSLYQIETTEIENNCEQIEVLAKQIHSKDYVFYSQMVRAFLYKREPQKSILFIDQMEETLNSNTIADSLVISYYLAKGFNLGLKDDFLLELEAYLKADSIAHRIEDDSKRIIAEADIKFYIMGYYTRLKKYDKALSMGKEILSIYKKQKDEGAMYENLIFNIGILFSKMQELDSSRYYIQKAIKLGASSNYDVYVEYIYLASVFASESKLDSSKIYINKYLEVCDQKFPKSINAISAYISASSIYMRLEEYDSASVLIKKAIEWSKPISYKKGLLRGYNLLLKNQLKRNKDSLSEVYLNQLLSVKDSIANRSTKDMEAKYQVKYDLEQEQTKNKALELAQEKQKRQRIYQWLLISILIGSVFLLLFIVNSYRNQKRKLANTVLEEKLNKLEIERELLLKQTELRKQTEYLRISKGKIEELELELNSHKETEKSKEFLDIIFSFFDQNYISDKEWMDIITMFDMIYPNLKIEVEKTETKLTPNENRILILLKLGYSNSSMSEILNISLAGVKKAKQRFKKKIGEVVYGLLISV